MAGLKFRSDSTKVKNIHVSIRDQSLTLKEDATPIRTYSVSTSRFGIGTEQGSFKTPIGRFRVVEKIGGDQPAGTIFQSRVPLGPGDPLPPTEDLVMSRILWLDGLDDHNANTRERFIYIHGTKHESKIGDPASYGCIRMRSTDVIELYNWISIGTGVAIVDKGIARAVRDLAEDHRLMATNTSRPDSRSDLVR